MMTLSHLETYPASPVVKATQKNDKRGQSSFYRRNTWMEVVGLEFYDDPTVEHER